jgi:hypothetical protein
MPATALVMISPAQLDACCYIIAARPQMAFAQRYGHKEVAGFQFATGRSSKLENGSLNRTA